MTIEEQRLAEWLRETTPEPPRQILLADVAARLPVPPQRRWLPALSAGCVAALVGGLIAVVALRGGGHDRRPPAAPSPSGRPSQSTTVRTPEPTLRTTAWHARLLGGAALQADTLQALGGRLYAMAAGHVVRLDPRTGAIVARSGSVSESVPWAAPVLAGGLLWTLGAASGGEVTAHGLDPASLTRQDSIQVHLAGLAPEVPAVLAPDTPDTFLVGGGGRVAFVDARARALTRRLVVSDDTIRDLSIAGDRLYVTTGAGATGSINVVNPATGTQLDVGPEVGPAFGVVATPGGVWFTWAGGHAANIEFAPRDDLGQARPVAGYSGGGLDVTVRIAGSTALLGGVGDLVCADADTGVVRAGTELRSHGGPVYFSGLTVVGAGVFGLYTDGDLTQSRLVVLRPPARCRVS